ncbi:MAG: hypothetical protein FJZ04_00890 [Candidatus Moranbacteria bacterium]|nr:hypothetical protein [Candidatus Moranbacteria bacterium]
MKKASIIFLKFFGLVIAVAFLGWYIGFLSQVNELNPIGDDQSGSSAVSQPIRKFPDLQDPKDVLYKWTYQKKPYELKLTLYKTAYDFYQSSPKEYSYSGELPQNWEEEYYGMFIRQNPLDKTINALADSLKGLAVRNRLSDDQTVEMIAAFAQNIPYDNDRARIIESGAENEKPNYPYEILYEQKGVCSDKSFLLTAILRELGFGTALFEYKSEKHLAIGIRCPYENSTYGSGYCYTETTQPGHKIGVIPDLSAADNLAVAKKELSQFSDNGSGNQAVKKLGTAKIFQKRDGRVYNGIVSTLKNQARINTLENEISSLKNELTLLKNQLESQNKAIDGLAKKLEGLKKAKNYAAYNSLVPEYNQKVGDNKKTSADYNRKVNLYNQKINEYNKLMKDFY